MNVERSSRISISKVNLTQCTLNMLSVSVNKPHFEAIFTLTLGTR